jgi:choline dehydrogenase-like flavoprotein
VSDPEHDVVVIGSGAGGAACAWRLAQRGLRVLLLEAGPAYDPAADYLLDQAVWEQKGSPEKVPVAGRSVLRVARGHFRMSFDSEAAIGQAWPKRLTGRSAI